jgi:hypothetical protein
MAAFQYEYMVDSGDSPEKIHRSNHNSITLKISYYISYFKLFWNDESYFMYFSYTNLSEALQYFDEN